MAQAPSMPPDAGNGDDLGITLGVEEEFFLVDPESRDLLADPDLGIFEICEKSSGPHKVVRELLRTQIETNTRVCESVAGVREALRETRRLVAGAAEEHGAALMAASTHPFAAWRAQVTTPKERYERFAISFQETVRRFLVGGNAHPCRLRRSGFAHPGHDRDAALPAPAPCAVRVVAVQCGERDPGSSPTG